jgi:hypothetical protein
MGMDADALADRSVDGKTDGRSLLFMDGAEP